MLVLGRKDGDYVTLIVPASTEATTITVTQLEIRGDKSRIGFDAPREVLITRDDLKTAAGADDENNSKHPLPRKENSEI